MLSDNGKRVCSVQRHSIPHPLAILQSRLQPLGGVSQCNFGLEILASDLLRGLTGDLSRFNRRIISQAARLGNFCITDTDICVLLAICTFVHGNNNCASETEVVLQSGVDVLHETAVVGPPSKLPCQFTALSQPSGSQWVALGDQASRWVDDDLATVGNVPVPHHMVGLALIAETKSFKGDKFIRAEAVVHFANFDVFGVDAGFGQRGLSSTLSHIISDQVHRAARIKLRRIRHQTLASNEDGFRLQVRSLVEELL